MNANAGRADLDGLLRAKHIPAEEPVFLLRARDPAAFEGVLGWAVAAARLGVPVAVIEQGLRQGEALAAFQPKRLPDTDHLTIPEIKQLEYQHSRRAWRAGLFAPADAVELMLAERRGFDFAMSAIRAEKRLALAEPSGVREP
jgi:hypothetical protein